FRPVSKLPRLPQNRAKSTRPRILWGTGKEGFDASHYAMDGGLAAMQSAVRFGRVVQTFRLGGSWRRDTIPSCSYAPPSFAKTVGAMPTGDLSSRTAQSAALDNGRSP